VSVEADRLHVLVARIDSIAVPMEHDWLHESERTRLDALKAPKRRQQYLAGHWLARDLLARTYGGGASDWGLRERRDRPPAVHAPIDIASTGPASIQLGLAHSRDWLAIAVGRQAFGIDIEQRGRQLTRAALEPVLLNPDEPADSLDDDDLLARWVMKEAWIKREQGSALPDQLRQLRVQRDDAGDVRVFRCDHYHLALAGGAATAFVGAEQPPLAAVWRVQDQDGC
jgi:phosphopantetheinyl transferase